ncbi:MAG: hypothetical protein ACK40A_08365 [Pannonibacter indicus]
MVLVAALYGVCIQIFTSILTRSLDARDEVRTDAELNAVAVSLNVLVRLQMSKPLMERQHAYFSSQDLACNSYSGKTYAVLIQDHAGKIDPDLLPEGMVERIVGQVIPGDARLQAEARDIIRMGGMRGIADPLADAGLPIMSALQLQLMFRPPSGGIRLARAVTSKEVVQSLDSGGSESQRYFGEISNGAAFDIVAVSPPDRKGTITILRTTLRRLTINSERYTADRPSMYLCRRDETCIASFPFDNRTPLEICDRLASLAQ